MRNFHFSRLFRDHDRDDFDCGIDELNEYFRVFVSQDDRRLLNTCYVLEEVDTKQIAGFYTLSVSSICRESLLAEFSDIPYDEVGFMLLGRLAVDVHFQGQGLGEKLLLDAVRRAMESSVQVAGLLVNPKDERAADFYLKYGFRLIESYMSGDISVSGGRQKLYCLPFPRHKALPSRVN